MKLIVLVLLLTVLPVSVVSAQPDGAAARVPSHKLVPGKPLRVTLTRFAVPDDAHFTPPSLMKSAVLPRDLLQYFKQAAKAQNITPTIDVFAPLVVADGRTQAFFLGEGVGSALARDKNGLTIDDHQATFHTHRLAITPAVRPAGVASVHMEETEGSYAEDDRTHIRSHETSDVRARTTMLLAPDDVALLPASFDDTMGKGRLFLSLVPADAPLRVRVQFIYVDTSLVGSAVSRLLPPPHVTIGDALMFFTRNLTKSYIRHKVTNGPVVVTESGVRFALDKRHIVPAGRIDNPGGNWLMGPRLALTPTIVTGDLVSVVLSIRDQEIVGPAGYWLAKPEVVEADSWPLFKAHSGSTVFLGGVWRSDKIERFTFATVTVLTPEKK